MKIGFYKKEIDISF